MPVYQVEERSKVGVWEGLDDLSKLSQNQVWL